MDKITIRELFDLNHTISKPYLEAFTYPWEALDSLSSYILDLIKTLSLDEYYAYSSDVYISKSAIVSESATIMGPAIIDSNAEIRVNAFLRGSVIVGKNSLVGSSCEIKNSILFDSVEVAHFNYVGDSILGYHSHLGAGAITSNVKSDKSNVIIKGERSYDTNRMKVGSFLSDYVEVGCNSVLNPGTIVGKNTNIYPLTSLRGVIGENSIVKAQDNIVLRNNYGIK